MRQGYLDTLKGLRDKNLIINAHRGARRCGKSIIMQLFRDYLTETCVGETQIVFMNFMHIENTKWLTDFDGLYYHILLYLQNPSHFTLKTTDKKFNR